MSEPTETGISKDGIRYFRPVKKDRGRITTHGPDYSSPEPGGGPGGPGAAPERAPNSSGIGEDCLSASVPNLDFFMPGGAPMGEVIQFVPKANPNRDTRTLEQQAIGILNALNLGFAVPDKTIYESSLGYLDPSKEPA